MSKTNHRRKNPNMYPNRDSVNGLHNGYSPSEDTPWRFIDKSLHGWGRISTLSDRLIGAGIGNDFSDGHRGMAHAVKGAKKFVRSRHRFHENATTQKLAREHFNENS